MFSKGIYLRLARTALIYAFDRAKSAGVDTTPPSTTEATDAAPTESLDIVKSQSQDIVKSPGLSTEQMLDYQNRELGKEMLLLEKHLQQGCKINNVACDCCQKHPVTIEGLAQEASGMSGNPVYSEIADWCRRSAPMTTPEASASGDYDSRYPELAAELRDMRKKL